LTLSDSAAGLATGLVTTGEVGSDATVGLTGVAGVLTGGTVTAGFAAADGASVPGAVMGLVTLDAADSDTTTGLTGVAAVLTSGAVTTGFAATGGVAVP
jgi:hypothetical protein